MLLILLLGGSSTVEASLTSKDLMRKQAIKMLEGSECHQKLDGLRLLERADGFDQLRDRAFEVYLACNASHNKALALILSASPESGDPTPVQVEVLERALASTSPVLRGTAAAILARFGKLSQTELTEGALAAEDQEERLFFCAVVHDPSRLEICSSFRQDLLPQIEELLVLPADELLSFKAKLLANAFPQRALDTTLKLSRRESNRADADAVGLIRAAWAESATTQALVESIRANPKVTTTTLQQIGFLRLSASEALALIEAGLQSKDSELLLLSINTAEAIGPDAAGLAMKLEELVLQQSDPIRLRAAQALVEISPSHAEALAKKLRATDDALFLEIKRRLIEKALD